MSRKLIVCHAGISARFLQTLNPASHAGVCKTIPECFPQSSSTSRQHFDHVVGCFRQTNAEGILLVRHPEMSDDFVELVYGVSNGLSVGFSEIEAPTPEKNFGIVAISCPLAAYWPSIEKTRAERWVKGSWHLTFSQSVGSLADEEAKMYASTMIGSLMGKGLSRLVFMGNADLHSQEEGHQLSLLAFDSLSKEVPKLDRITRSFGFAPKPNRGSTGFCFQPLKLAA